MKPESVAPIDSHVPKSRLAGALINPDTALGDTSMLTAADGARYYLPVFQDATQSAGGEEALAPSLSQDGTLTIHLLAQVPPDLAGHIGDAKSDTKGVTAALRYTDNGTPQTTALNLEEKLDNIWKASVKLAGAQLEAVRKVLLDVVPAASVQLSRRVRMAAPLTKDFVVNNWPNPGIQKMLKNTFSGMHMPDAATFYAFATKVYPLFSQEYMTLDCSYVSEVAIPPLPGFIQWKINWNGRAFDYYQDNQQLNRVFYYPDSFALATNPSGGAPTVSLLQFTKADPNAPASVKNTNANFRFYGKAVVDGSRIADAKNQLRSRIHQEPQMVSLQDADGVHTQMSLALPNATGTSGSQRIQQAANIKLRDGITNQIVLGFEAFKALWAAIFSDEPQQTLFTGWVDATFSGGKYAERVDFRGRLAKGDMETYYSDIVDTQSDINYQTSYEIMMPRVLFSSLKLLMVTVTIGDKSVSLTDPGDSGPALLKEPLVLDRSASDLLLGLAADADNSYSLQLMKDDGSTTCCEGTASTNQIILAKTALESCTGACTD